MRARQPIARQGCIGLVSELVEQLGCLAGGGYGVATLSEPAEGLGPASQKRGPLTTVRGGPIQQRVVEIERPFRVAGSKQEIGLESSCRRRLLGDEVGDRNPKPLA